MGFNIPEVPVEAARGTRPGAGVFYVFFWGAVALLARAGLESLLKKK